MNERGISKNNNENLSQEDLQKEKFAIWGGADKICEMEERYDKMRKKSMSLTEIFDELDKYTKEVVDTIIVSSQRKISILNRVIIVNNLTTLCNIKLKSRPEFLKEFPEFGGDKDKEVESYENTKKHLVENIDELKKETGITIDSRLLLLDEEDFAEARRLKEAADKGETAKPAEQKEEQNIPTELEEKKQAEKKASILKKSVLSIPSDTTSSEEQKPELEKPQELSEQSEIVDDFSPEAQSVLKEVEFTSNPEKEKTVKLLKEFFAERQKNTKTHKKMAGLIEEMKRICEKALPYCEKYVKKHYSSEQYTDYRIATDSSFGDGYQSVTVNFKKVGDNTNKEFTISNSLNPPYRLLSLNNLIAECEDDGEKNKLQKLLAEYSLTNTQLLSNMYDLWYEREEIAKKMLTLLEFKGWGVTGLGHSDEYLSGLYGIEGSIKVFRAGKPEENSEEKVWKLFTEKGINDELKILKERLQIADEEWEEIKNPKNIIEIDNEKIKQLENTSRENNKLKSENLDLKQHIEETTPKLLAELVEDELIFTEYLKKISGEDFLSLMKACHLLDELKYSPEGGSVIDKGISMMKEIYKENIKTIEKDFDEETKAKFEIFISGVAEFREKTMQTIQNTEEQEFSADDLFIVRNKNATAQAKALYKVCELPDVQDVRDNIMTALFINSILIEVESYFKSYE